jgi:hypothetical protein
MKNLLPNIEDYIRTMNVLLEKFEIQQTEKKKGHPFTYRLRTMLIFFTFMHLRQIIGFKAKERWLKNHPWQARQFGFMSIPVRTTISRRYKTVDKLLESLIVFVARETAPLDARLGAEVAVSDKSLFKTQGPVWHQKQRLAGIIPKGLRHLDTDASWSKSAYHGWVYGYGLHLVTNAFGFPLLAKVETASVNESKITDRQESALLAIGAKSYVGDDAYTNLHRVRRYAKAGTVFLAPGLRLGDGPKQSSYKRFIKNEENAQLLAKRKTMIEPVFDLISQIAFTRGNQKQLAVQFLKKVRPFLLFSVWLLQIGMVVNSIYGMPLRNTSQMMAVLT